jgi:hypothetical protein
VVKLNCLLYDSFSDKKTGRVHPDRELGWHCYFRNVDWRRVSNYYFAPKRNDAELGKYHDFIPG